MKTQANERLVFHISPWRLWLPWMIFAPLIILFLALAWVIPAAKQGEKEALMLIAGLFGLIAACIWLLIRRARLEITTQGVRLRQTGFTLESAWSEVSELILIPGEESFITKEAMTGKGCARLAAAAELGRLVSGFYSKDRLELIAQYRLIPIEAFSWHLRKGQRLQNAIARFAPQLQAELAKPPEFG